MPVFSGKFEKLRKFLKSLQVSIVLHQFLTLATESCIAVKFKILHKNVKSLPYTEKHTQGHNIFYFFLVKPLKMSRERVEKGIFLLCNNGPNISALALIRPHSGFSYKQLINAQQAHQYPHHEKWKENPRSMLTNNIFFILHDVFIYTLEMYVFLTHTNIEFLHLSIPQPVFEEVFQ